MKNLHRRMLEHRLSVPDCIVEAITDCDDPKYTENEIVDAIESIERRIFTDNWDGLTDCEQEVLHDLVDGSTWFANSREMSPQMFAAHDNAAMLLEGFVSGLIGGAVYFPRR